jgi:DNA-directed RNA polymerase subunit beta
MALTPILQKADDHREQIRKNAVDAIAGAFPMQIRNQAIRIEDVKVHTRDFGPKEQKAALLEGRTLHEPVKGTVVLYDEAGKEKERLKNFTLLHLPYFTDRHTFVIGGHEYQVANQLRMKPGVYARRRQNGELEAAFNLARGANFNVTLDPERGHPYVEYGTTRIPLYPVLRRLGVQHDEIASAWGAPVANANAQAFEPKKFDAHVDKLYGKLVHPAKQTHTTIESKLTAIKDHYANTVMDATVNSDTLGKAHDKVTPSALLDASNKLLRVYKSGDDVDDRDSLAFKTVHSAADFVKERIGLDARLIAAKVKGRASSKVTLRDLLPPAPFTPGVKSFLSGSSLAEMPMQINPVELIDRVTKVTSLGEGGISSERAVPVEARHLHGTHLGILDPVRTPETFRAGVDIRVSATTHRDAKGDLYTTVKDLKANKVTHLSARDVYNSYVAFPGQPITGVVDAMHRGQVQHVPASQVQYQFVHATQMFSPTAQLLPFIESIQGNRATMGSKMQTQALPLLEREAPLVQAMSKQFDHSGKEVSRTSFEKVYGQMVVRTSPVAGRVHKVDDEYVYIQPDSVKKAEVSEYATPDSDFEKNAADGDLVKVPYERYFPFASKTGLNHHVVVKPGDRVSKGTLLADSNFTRDGALALGRNMSVAYMPYYGLNSNDAVVISEGAAKKLTSEHLYKEALDVLPDTKTGREPHRQYYGTKYTRDQYDKLDEDGVIKKGSRVLPHDPLIVALERGQPSSTDQILGNFRKALLTPYRERVVTWEHGFEGEVIDVYKTPKRLVVTVKTHEPMQIGDKLCGRYGNKGVVSRIIPDHQMVHDESGTPIDVLYTAAGVISRINPAQVIETAVAKVADKTKKPIVVEAFSGKDNVQWAKDLLKEHGVKDKETVYDPVSGKHIPNITVGKQYTLKLFKTTDTNFSARGEGGYDVNQQPAKGGEQGSKGLGKLEFNALLVHNARNVLRETAALKSQKNDEFWRAVQLGLPLPALKAPFAFDKFVGMLHGAGIKVDRTGNKLALGPLTDKDVLRMSSGAIENERLIRARDMQPERGGLFDPAVTGGAQGTMWSHVDLAEPVVNPVFAEPVRRLLGLTQAGFDKLHAEKGGAHIRQALNKIDVDERLAALRKDLKALKGSEFDGALKQIKYLDAIKKQGLTAGDAYVISKMPVLPPVMRPILPGKGGGDMVVGDSNYLYQTLMLHNRALDQQNKDNLLPPNEHVTLRKNLYQAVGAVVGTHDTDNPKLAKRNVKGFLEHVTGKTTPKSSFFQQRLLKRQQDLSGRGTIAPDGSLDMDEIGLPEDMLWNLFGKFVIARLVRQGFSALQAKEMVDNKHPAARDALMVETKERPVFVNRAPTLHKYNLVGAYAVPTPGKTIRVNPFIEKGMNADYDGDAFQVHVPVMPQAVHEVKKMTLSNLIFNDKQYNDLMVLPDHEAVLGVHLASKAPAAKPGKVHKFKTKSDAMAAYKKGEITLQDQVEIG